MQFVQTQQGPMQAPRRHGSPETQRGFWTGPANVRLNSSFEEEPPMQQFNLNSSGTVYLMPDGRGGQREGN